MHEFEQGCLKMLGLSLPSLLGVSLNAVLNQKELIFELPFEYHSRGFNY